MSNIYNIKVKNLSGEETTLTPFKGKLMLIVNVASKCGFTPQYKGLQELYQAFQSDLVVLGFPCNQFGHQEPGSSQEIKQFCDLSYQITFPLFEKIEVNGAGAHPLYQFLKQERPGLLGTEAIKWNFTKFLVDRQGQVVKRYAPNDTPASIRKDLEAYL